VRKLGKDLFLDEKTPRHESGLGYVRVVEHSVLWKYNHVRNKRGEDERRMAMFIRGEVEHQERLEAAGYRSPLSLLLIQAPLLFLASISFSTEDSFSHVFKPSWCAVPLHWSRSAPHNPIFSGLDCAFAFLPPLFIQAIPQEDSWSLLVPPEPDCSSAGIWEEGRSRHRRLSLQLCRRE
jgi:hypothetical protein